ncbi:hypothetical protein, partial [Streptomyces sp. P5_D11]
EIAQQSDGHDQTDNVLGSHSFATPLATRATSAKTAIVVTTKAMSATVCSSKRFGLNGPVEETPSASGHALR